MHGHLVLMCATADPRSHAITVIHVHRVLPVQERKHEYTLVYGGKRIPTNRWHLKKIHQKPACEQTWHISPSGVRSSALNICKSSGNNQTKILQILPQRPYLVPFNEVTAGPQGVRDGGRLKFQSVDPRLCTCHSFRLTDAHARMRYTLSGRRQCGDVHSVLSESKLWGSQWETLSCCISLSLSLTHSLPISLSLPLLSARVPLTLQSDLHLA